RCGNLELMRLLAKLKLKLVFFFSSRRRHTRFDCDWSSDVCSSDLDSGCAERVVGAGRSAAPGVVTLDDVPDAFGDDGFTVCIDRSEERRVGKECRSGGSACA